MKSKQLQNLRNYTAPPGFKISGSATDFVIWSKFNSDCWNIIYDILENALFRMKYLIHKSNISWFEYKKGKVNGRYM